MKFLCLAQPDPGFTPGPRLVAEYAALGEAMRAAGVLIDSGQLSPGDAAKLVRVTAGQVYVSDGPPPGAPARRPAPTSSSTAPTSIPHWTGPPASPLPATAQSKSARLGKPLSTLPQPPGTCRD